MEPVIIVNQLSRVVRERGGALFRKPKMKTILHEVSLVVDQGEWLVILGKNGSGKSTLLKCISGILNPTSGEVKVFGLNPWRNRIQVTRRMGILFGQKSMLFPDLRVIDSLRLYQRVYSVEDRQFDEMLSFAHSFLGTNSLLELNVRRISFGERMRCELLSTILHKPDLLILDEPFVGLDPIAQKGLLDFLNAFQKTYHVTILMTTHQYLQSLQNAKQVVVLDAGKVKYSGGYDLFMRFANRKEVRVHFSEKGIHVPDIPGVKVLNANDHLYVIDLDTSITSTKELLDRLGSHHEIVDFEVRGIPVERMVEELYADSSDPVVLPGHSS